jgi:membrane protein
MWFLLSAYVVLFGAELNAEMELQTARDTTDVREKSHGKRGAHRADDIGAQRRK